MKHTFSLIGLLLLAMSCSPTTIEKTPMIKQTNKHPLDQSKSKKLILDNGLKIF